MPKVTFENNTYTVEDNETLLECLLRHKLDYPCGCRAGRCHSCLSVSDSDNLDPTWQEGLDDRLKDKGYFLPCKTKPVSDISLRLPNKLDVNVRAIVLEKEPLTANVIRLKLKTAKLANFTPGQYINIVNPDNVIRSYSIANLPEQDGHIELNIKLWPEGLMSSWLINEVEPRKVINIRGPAGDCFYYNPDKKQFNMLLAGTGTGLAPLFAIARDALTQNHDGNITLIHGGVTDADLYYVDLLKELAETHNNFQYFNCVLRDSEHYPSANIMDLMLEKLSDPQNTHFYACGPEDTTNELKKKAFLAGVPSSTIFSDTFLSS